MMDIVMNVCFCVDATLVELDSARIVEAVGVGRAGTVVEMILDWVEVGRVIEVTKAGVVDAVAEARWEEARIEVGDTDASEVSVVLTS